MLNSKIRRAPARRVSIIETLEQRRLFTVVAAQPLSDFATTAGAFPTTIDLATRFNSTTISGSVVRFATTFGGASANIDLELFNQRTPLTAANFLSYVNSGRYDSTFFHRSVSNFVVQGGGFVFPSGDPVRKDPTVQNEFAASPRDGQSKVNTRGTIAMAKRGNDPNSADSEFFFNLGDNSSNLDNQNGGFTTFARVLGTGMTVVDQIGALPIQNFGSTFNELPVANFTTGQELRQENVVFVNSARVVPALTFSVQSSNLSLVNPVLEGSSLRLVYQPNVIGAATITVTASDLDGATLSSTFNVLVGGGATPAVFNGDARVNPASPSTVNFGAILPSGTAPITRSVILENTGSSDLTNLSYSLPAGYNFVGNPPTSVQSGQRVNLTLQIDTATTGDRQGNLTITAPSSSVPSFTVPLSSSVRLPVRLTGATKSVTYVQGSGASATTVTFTHAGPGASDFVFTGSGLTTTVNRGVVTIAGPTEAQLVGVTLAQTTTASNLTLATRGPSLAVVPIVTGAGTAAVNRLDLRRARLTTSLTFGSSGASNAVVRQLRLGEAANAAIAIGTNNDPRAALVFSVGSASSTTFVAGYPVTSFTANSWTGAAAAGAISGSNFRTISIRSDLSSNLTATGNLGTAAIGGRLAGGTWTVAGAISKLTAATGETPFRLSATGNIASAAFRGPFNGTLSAGTLGTFSADSGTGSTVTAQTTIKTVAFRRGLVNAFISAGTVLNRFSAASIDQSFIYAGVINPSATLPTQLSQFAANSSIGSVTLTARGNNFAFSASSISARQIGTLKFNAVQSVSPQASGIAADTIRSVSFFTDANQRINLRNVTSQSQVPTIASTSATPSNFSLRLL